MFAAAHCHFVVQRSMENLVVDVSECRRGGGGVHVTVDADGNYTGPKEVGNVAELVRGLHKT